MARHCSLSPLARAACAVTASLLLVSGAAFAQESAIGPTGSERAPQAAARVKVGLALGGGAARGIAHVGLLKWMEEHRIPVDFIAGTSMGGLIGGGYSSGMSPDELLQLMKEVDWNLVFLADSPFKYKTFRRKQDARLYPAQIEFGLKKGFSLPSGLNAGEQIELLFDRIALPYYDLADFNQLPTPFRSVATDLRKAEVVVFGSGSLARAMRATMAIPGFFTPVVDGDRILVDGGTLNNVPVDVTRQMGADAVIAVNVGSSTDQPPPPSNLFSVLGQTIDTMMQVGVKRVIDTADLVVTPDLKGLTGMDWRKSDELVERGYQAAEAIKDDLLKYAVDEATYGAWMRERQSRRRTTVPDVVGIRVEGVSEKQSTGIQDDFEREFAGRPIDREAVEERILRLTGTDRYEVVGYSLEPVPGGTNLVVRVTPKSYGPPFLLPAIDLQNVDANTFSLDLRARVAVYDTFVSQSEIRADFGIGSREFASVEFYRRLGGSDLFVAPRGYFIRKPLNAYNADGDFVAEYSEKRTGAGLDVGFTAGLSDEVRLGYDIAEVRTRRRIGQGELPEADGSDRFLSLRWVHDGQNSPVIPSRGLYSQMAVRYYFDTPTLVFDTGTSDARDFAQAEGRLSWFTRWHERHRVFLYGSAGTSFNDDPGYNQFRLGGPLNLGAFNQGEIFGDNYLLGGVGFLWNWFRLPDVLGGNAYLGGWFENGSAFDEWDDAEYEADISGGFVMETILGPFFIGGAVSLNEGDTRFYVSLAPFVK